jgi:hypothetical protein
VQPLATSRTRRLVFRWLATGIAALIFVISVDSSDPRWYEQLAEWLQRTPGPAPIKSASASRPPGPPISVTPMRPEGTDSSVSATPLPLILVRTQRGRNNREGFAQIGVRARSPQTYMAGALLANGARLTEIYEHFVVLEHQGRTVRLYLNGETQAGSGAVSESLTVGGTPHKPIPTDKSDERLTTYLRPSPVFAGDQLQGLALYPGRHSGPFSDLGLQPGDVLMRINGSPIADVATTFASLRTLMHGDVLSIDIERQGVSQSLSLHGAIIKRAVSTESEEVPIAQTVVRTPALSVAYPTLLTSEK